MERLEPFQIWFLMAAVAYLSYLFGRASAGPDREERERRRQIEEQQVENAFAQLSPSKLEEVDRLMEERKKIEAIRCVREETGLGLKLAKLAVERRAAGRGL